MSSVGVAYLTRIYQTVQVRNYKAEHSGQWFLDTVKEEYFYNKVSIKVRPSTEGMRRNGTYVQWFREGVLSEWYLMREVRSANNRGIWKRRVQKVLQEWL